MIVLVCGGRKYSNRVHVFKVLGMYHGVKPIEHLIQGGASGVDNIARAWAECNNVNYTTYNAKWDDYSDPCVIGYGHFGKYNKLAGGKRNQKMLDEGKPDRVFAFPGGTGTADMVRRAQKAGVPVLKFSPRDETVDISDLKSEA